jgi:hypothetical protein
LDRSLVRSFIRRREKKKENGSHGKANGKKKVMGKNRRSKE